MKKASKIFSWVLTIFMILAALVYMPSVASVFMVIFAAIAIPIYRVQEFWAAKRLSGFIKTIALLVLFLVSIFLAPTDRYRHDSEEESQNPASNEELELEEPGETAAELLEVDFDVSIGGEAGRPAFIIKTNLPDETVLMLTVNGEDGSTFQSEAIIENGMTESEQFGSESNLVPEKFSLGISMSLPSLQSDAVRAVIGENGENLSGEYVEESNSFAAKIVSAKFEYDFSSKEGTSTQSTFIEATPEPEPEPVQSPAPVQEPEPEQTPPAASVQTPEVSSPSTEQAATSTPYSSGSWGESSTTNEITGNFSRTAYWTNGGKSYHFSADCPSLSRSKNIQSGTLQDALNAGKKDPCNNCANGS